MRIADPQLRTLFAAVTVDGELSATDAEQLIAATADGPGLSKTEAADLRRIIDHVDAGRLTSSTEATDALLAFVERDHSVAVRSPLSLWLAPDIAPASSWKAALADDGGVIRLHSQPFAIVPHEGYSHQKLPNNSCNIFNGSLRDLEYEDGKLKELPTISVLGDVDGAVEISMRGFPTGLIIENRPVNDDGTFHLYGRSKFDSEGGSAHSGYRYNIKGRIDDEGRLTFESFVYSQWAKKSRRADICDGVVRSVDITKTTREFRLGQSAVDLMPIVIDGVDPAEDSGVAAWRASLPAIDGKVDATTAALALSISKSSTRESVHLKRRGVINGSLPRFRSHDDGAPKEDLPRFSIRGDRDGDLSITVRGFPGGRRGNEYSRNAIMAALPSTIKMNVLDDGTFKFTKSFPTPWDGERKDQGFELEIRGRVTESGQLDIEVFELTDWAKKAGDPSMWRHRHYVKGDLEVTTFSRTLSGGGAQLGLVPRQPYS